MDYKDFSNITPAEAAWALFEPRASTSDFAPLAELATSSQEGLEALFAELIHPRNRLRLAQLPYADLLATLVHYNPSLGGRICDEILDLLSRHPSPKLQTAAQAARDPRQARIAYADGIDMLPTTPRRIRPQSQPQPSSQPSFNRIKDAYLGSLSASRRSLYDEHERHAEVERIRAAQSATRADVERLPQAHR